VQACDRLANRLFYKLGSQTEAIATCRKGTALLEDGQAPAPTEMADVLATAGLYFSLGDILSTSRKAPQEGLHSCEKGLQLLQPLLSPTHRPAALLSKLAHAYALTAQAQHNLSQHESAEQGCRKAVELSEELVATHPGVAKYQFDLGSFYNDLFVAQLGIGQRQQALVSLNKAVELKERLAGRYRDVPDYQANLVRSLTNLSRHTTDQEQARTSQRRAELLARELNRLNPGMAQYQTALAGCLQCGADLHQRAKEFQKAVTAQDEAIAVWEKLVQATDVAVHRTALTQAYLQKSVLASQAGKPELAADALGKATALQPTDPVLFYRHGTALLNANRLEDATRALNMALALKPDYAEARCNLGHALVRQGRVVEGLAALQRGHEIGVKQQGWPYPSISWVRNDEKLIQLDGRLNAIFKENAEPADTRERLALAQLCRQNKQLYAASARFYTEAFAADPKRAEDLKALHRYNAACAAALAGCGRGADGGNLDDKQRATWRKQARDWLAADLVLWAKQAEKAKSVDRTAIRKQLQHWQTDDDLDGVRDEKALSVLPAEEQAAWRKLWADVALILDKVGEK
jgi:tetratricopeptide (TPR) repeat protein